MSADRKRPHVMLTLAPDELALLDAQADGRGLPRSRMVAELVREEARRAARRESPR